RPWPSFPHTGTLNALNRHSRNLDASRSLGGARPAIRLLAAELPTGPQCRCLKNGTARPGCWAASRVANVPRFLRLPVLARTEFAESRILDADVAWDAANLVRYQILQRAGAALLGQANQQPALAIQLLRG